MSFFRRFPIVTLVAYGSTALAVLIVLQGSGVLHGRAAQWVDATVGLLQVILTAYAKQHVTPVAAPRDAYGNRLVPASMTRRGPTADQIVGTPVRSGSQPCSHGYRRGNPEGHICEETLPLG